MNNLWSKLAPRERRLAVGVVAALLFLLVTTTAVRSVKGLNELDDTINRFESDLRMYTELEARRVNVQQAYSVVAQQHSSEWTEAEIHNRLRQEIYRLARTNPDAPADTQQENLIEIPTLRQGVLRNSGQGYREYRLNVNIPLTTLPALIEFLIRLQSSPQSLRVDGLEIARAPQATTVSARLDVTRTVVDGVEGEPEPPAPQQAETWDGATIDLWKADGCDIALSPDMNGITATGGCLKAVATAPGGSFGMAADLGEPGTYEVEIDAMATGPARLEVKDETTGQIFDGGADIAGDSLAYHYKLRFQVAPTEEGAPVRIAVPHVTITDAGTQVFVDLVTLRKVSG
ncbi:MAG: hypothetical protein NTZ09_13770 [Candidatus Hydrogenedentes bacterium]|nr:hypothetical protein [Candidatus Hydrogenedentota bacterium]